jgi:hypothetical protein
MYGPRESNRRQERAGCRCLYGALGALAAVEERFGDIPRQARLKYR